MIRREIQKKYISILKIQSLITVNWVNFNNKKIRKIRFYHSWMIRTLFLYLYIFIVRNISIIAPKIYIF